MLNRLFSWMFIKYFHVLVCLRTSGRLRNISRFDWPYIFEGWKFCCLLFYLHIRQSGLENKVRICVGKSSKKWEG